MTGLHSVRGKPIKKKSIKSKLYVEPQVTAVLNRTKEATGHVNNKS